MRENPWQEQSYDLAALLAHHASRALSNPAVKGDEQLRALKLLAGRDWSRGAVRGVIGHELSSIIQWDLRHPMLRKHAGTAVVTR